MVLASETPNDVTSHLSNKLDCTYLNAFRTPKFFFIFCYVLFLLFFAGGGFFFVFSNIKLIQKLPLKYTAIEKIVPLIWIIKSSLFKVYFMKPKSSALKEKMFYVLSVISLFTSK